MKNLAIYPVCIGCLLFAVTSHAIDLKQSKLTQVVNDVQIISAADQKQKTASVNDIFTMPDVLRTGAASRAELVAEDETVTRVGANTIFSFDPANRTIDLKQGSLLFHSEHGKGGGSIHTGSATASVLGTTIIVVTTRNGGFKVIALEGEVEVKFLNGLKQKLDPGQMTFVLPGANQLAPVVIFRLDELVDNSLLVKGFTQPLASLPLIQNQIIQQGKLIQSGKVTDTGLYAGDNANANQVEVLDVNTVSHSQQPPSQQPPQNSPPTPPPLQPNLSAAEGADATINQSSLTDASVPTPPNHIYLAPFSLTGNSYLSGKTFSGFVAKNIYFNTLGIGSSPDAVSLAHPNGISSLVVDLSPYSTVPTFDFVGVNNISFEGPVTFKGLSSDSMLAFYAGNQFNFTPGVYLNADIRNLLFSSPATLSLDNVGLYNGQADINLNSSADISLLNSSSVSANGRLIMSAGNGISVVDSQLSGDSALLTSLNGSITFNNSLLDTASHAILISPTAISLNNSTINSDFITLSSSGSSTININNTTLNGSSSIVAVSANTISVNGSSSEPSSAVRSKTDVIRGSTLYTDPNSGVVNLTSIFGSVNVSGTSITAHYLTLNSGDGILLDAYGHSITSSGPNTGSTANFSAPNLITVNNADFSSFAVLNMAAKTIVLNSDVLATISNFASQTGQVNVNGQEIYGGLNLYNCTWQNTPVTSASQVTLSSGPGNSPGIYSYAR